MIFIRNIKKMGKVVKLSINDIEKIVKKTIDEQIDINKSQGHGVSIGKDEETGEYYVIDNATNKILGVK
jgi:hypothetical protein